MLFIRLIMLLLSALLIIGGVLYINSSISVFYTFIVGFVTSSLVILASFKSYKNAVNNRIEVNLATIEIDDRDLIDKIDDPYNLYDKSEADENIDIQEVIKEEKKLLKKSKRGFLETLKSSATAFSFYRLVAYVIFVSGFFYLLKGDKLSIISYLATIFLPNMIVIIYLLNFNKVTK